MHVLNHLNCLTLCDPMDRGLPGPLSMGFARQEYCSGLPCPSPGNLPNPEIKPASLVTLELAHRVFTTSTTWEAPYEGYFLIKKT